MSKTKRVFLIIATICVVAGIALCGTAYALTGFDINALSTNKPKIEQHFESSSADIDTITFKSIEDSVQIKRANIQNIQIDYWDNDSVTYEIKEDDGSGNLTITQDYKWRFNSMIFNWDTEDRSVVITVPESFDGTLDLVTISGAIILDKGLSSLQQLEANTVSGTIDYQLQDVDDLKIQTVSGLISGSVFGVAGKASFNSVSSDINLEFGAVSLLKIQTVSGRVETYVIDNPQENYRFDTDSISANIDIPASSKTAKNDVTLKTISGDISFLPVNSLNPSRVEHLD
jgi:DUF4097 and DUF4098 domain-containing protein YvlB